MTADAMKKYDNDLEKNAECTGMRAALSRLREIRLRLRFKRNTLGEIHVV